MQLENDLNRARTQFLHAQYIKDSTAYETLFAQFCNGSAIPSEIIESLAEGGESMMFAGGKCLFKRLREVYGTLPDSAIPEVKRQSTHMDPQKSIRTNILERNQALEILRSQGRQVSY